MNKIEIKSNGIKINYMCEIIESDYIQTYDKCIYDNTSTWFIQDCQNILYNNDYFTNYKNIETGDILKKSDVINIYIPTNHINIYDKTTKLLCQVSQDNELIASIILDDEIKKSIPYFINDNIFYFEKYEFKIPKIDWTISEISITPINNNNFIYNIDDNKTYGYTIINRITDMLKIKNEIISNDKNRYISSEINATEKLIKKYIYSNPNQYLLKLIIMNEYEGKIYDIKTQTSNSFINKYEWTCPIFSSWEQWEEGLVIKTSFCIKTSGYEENEIEIISQPIIITKEVFSLLVENNMNIQKINFNEIDMVTNNIEIINEINKNIININRQKENLLTIKPQFFKSIDINNITIHKNVKERISINLGFYKNKVEEFIMRIGDNNINENGRIGDEIIFFLDTSKMNLNEEGDVLILNSNNELVTTGKYILK